MTPAIVWTLAATVVAIVASATWAKPWIRATSAMLLYVALFAAVSVGMGGLRAQVVSARAEGKSEQFVEGLIARNAYLMEARAGIFILGTGLAVVALIAIWGPLRGPTLRDVRRAEAERLNSERPPNQIP